MLSLDPARFPRVGGPRNGFASGGSISSPDVVSGFQRQQQKASDENLRRKNHSKVVIQRQHEKIMVSEGGTCPMEQQERLTSKFFNLKPAQLKNIADTQFFNPSVMAALACVTESIYFESSTSKGFLSKNARIRHWMQNLKRIGGESAEGFAMAASMREAEDLFVLKAPRDPSNEEFIHELFLGLYAINGLRAIIPNFAYVYGGFVCDAPYINESNKKVLTWCGNGARQGKPVQYIIYENVAPSITFGEYATKASPSHFLSAYMQFVYATYIAYKMIGWTHWDLHNENGLMRDASKATGAKEYYIPMQNKRGETIYIKSDRVATIIDYGRSHAVVDGKDYGYDFIGAYIYPDHIAPLFDLYKLLMFTSAYISNTGTLQIAERIMRYFNQTETIIDAINLQRDAYYSLPLDHPNVQRMSIEKFIDYLEVEFVNEFRDIIVKDVDLTKTSSIPVLECEKFCYSTENVYSAATKGLPRKNLVEFYDNLKLAQRKGDRKRVEELSRSIDYATMIRSHTNTLEGNINNFVTKINSVLQIPPPRKNLYSLFTTEALNDTKRRINNYYEIMGNSRSIATDIVAGQEVSLTFKDDSAYKRFNNLASKFNMSATEFNKRIKPNMDRMMMDIKTIISTNERAYLDAVKKNFELRWYSTVLSRYFP